MGYRIKYCRISFSRQMETLILSFRQSERRSALSVILRKEVTCEEMAEVFVFTSAS